MYKQIDAVFTGSCDNNNNNNNTISITGM